MSDSDLVDSSMEDPVKSNRDKLMALVDPSIEYSNAMADAWVGITIGGTLLPLMVVLYLGGLQLISNAPSAIIGLFQMSGVVIIGYIAACIAGLLGLGVVCILRAILKPFLSLRMTLSIFPGVSVCIYLLPFWALPSKANVAVIILTLIALVLTHAAARTVGYRGCNFFFHSRVFPETFQIGIATLLKLTAGVAFLVTLAKLIGFDQFHLPFAIYLVAQVILVVVDHALWRIYFRGKWDT